MLRTGRRARRRRDRGAASASGPGRAQARRNAARQQRRRSARLRCPPVCDVPDPVCRTAPCYSTLLRVDPTDYNKLIPDLAEQIDVSADGKTVTFHLRSGVNFHNGRR